jgi:hypothetical protein
VYSSIIKRPGSGPVKDVAAQGRSKRARNAAGCGNFFHNMVNYHGFMKKGKENEKKCPSPPSQKEKQDYL